MPFITVNDQGHYLYYEDTGTPPTNDGLYTTLIIVHGTGFHGQIFRRLLPLAPQHSVRLVLVNRRDYPKSSPYTEEDLDNVRTGDVDKQTAFAKARASEFARFIKSFIENESVPKASQDWRRGGVVLMAWSSGNSYTLPLLAYIDSIPQSTRDFIEPYLRSHIVFDAARWILGLPEPQDILKDPSLPAEERARRFSIWVSGYYKHKSLTSRNVADLQAVVSGDTGGSRKKGTVEAMTPQELEETTSLASIARSEIAARTGSPGIFAERIRRAVFDDTLARTYWPRVGIDVVWCEHTPWLIVDSMWEFQRLREKADREGIKGRRLTISMIPEANHFPHWDEPEKTMKFFADLINPPALMTSKI